MKLFCKIGLHSWKTKKEKYEIVDHPNGRKQIRVRVKGCRFCGERQYYSLPDKNENRVWKPWSFKKNDKIKLEQIK